MAMTMIQQKDNRRCSAHRVLHEASASIRELKHEEEMLTKTIEKLQCSDSYDDNDTHVNISNINMNQYPCTYGVSFNQLPFTSGTGAQSPSCSSSSLPLLLLEPSMSAFGIILLKTAVDGKRLDASENVTKLFACSREEAIENDPDKRVPIVSHNHRQSVGHHLRTM
jgi:hypothetical protein